MLKAWKSGISFGLTSGVITTLGLLIGLNASTGSKSVVLSGILVIAVADALSDALGIHLSLESDSSNSHKDVWAGTLSSFLTKFFVALTFVIPILLFELFTAVIVSVVYGMILISVLSVNLAKKRNEKAWTVVGEHLCVSLIVVVLSHVVGYLVSFI